MATKTVYVSDLSGAELAEGHKPLTWSWGGKALTIDLTDTERAAFEKAIHKYLAASSPARSATPSAATRPSASRRTPGPQTTDTPLDGMKGAARKRELDAIRAWCVENDIEVNMNGRIADAPIQAFYARKSA